jgi:hypothetical protein
VVYLFNEPVMKTGSKKFHFRIIIKLKDSAHLQMLGEPSLDDFISSQKIDRLLTSASSKKISELLNEARRKDHSYRPPNFLNYYCIGCSEEEKVREALNLLNKSNEVEYAYVETHSASPPPGSSNSNPLEPYQWYLNEAPVGINARYAWQFPGGDGTGKVKFMDIEQGWIMDHEDIIINYLPSTGFSHHEHESHGTAVLGVIMMRNNEVGGIGITPHANGYLMSQWRPDGTFNTADAIMAAIVHLNFGDILLLEAQSFDSLYTKKVWPVETLEANFQLIRLATALGIIVIEAAGNGMYSTGNDLDDFIDHNGNNIFSRSKSCFKESGAIMVAAASSDVPHRKINYSNYGSRIDCYAWGENVITAGSYPLLSGLAKNTYSYKFSGTSSASAIVAGAAIALQSIVEEKYDLRIHPKQMRLILSDEKYGTASKHGHLADKIGVMPDLKKITDHLSKPGFIKKHQGIKNIKEKKFQRRL